MSTPKKDQTPTKGKTPPITGRDIEVVAKAFACFKEQPQVCTYALFHFAAFPWHPLHPLNHSYVFYHPWFLSSMICSCLLIKSLVSKPTMCIIIVVWSKYDLEKSSWLSPNTPKENINCSHPALIPLNSLVHTMFLPRDVPTGLVQPS